MPPRKRRSYADDTEHQLQAACIYWAQLQGNVWPELHMLYHIRNEGKRGFVERRKAKEAGLKPGMPDLHLPVGGRGWLSLYTELKKPGETPEPHQLAVMRDLLEYGNLVYCIDNFADFQMVHTWYLGYEDSAQDPLLQAVDGQPVRFVQDGSITFKWDDNFMLVRELPY